MEPSIFGQFELAMTFHKDKKSFSHLYVSVWAYIAVKSTVHKPQICVKDFREVHQNHQVWTA